MNDVCTAAPDICLPGTNTVVDKFIDSSGQIMLPDSMVLADKVTPLTVDNLISALPRSPLGGLQGSGGQLGLFGLNINYAPGSLADRLVESFAGPHDFLNSTHFYGPNGNASYAAGLWGKEIWNAIDIPLAAPFGIATFCNQVPALCGGVNNAISAADHYRPPALPPTPNAPNSEGNVFVSQLEGRP
jgi:hypothetical protein